jgi:D-arabinose 1-dehydrogenase-like Zn-dependent alcohol dehydrogenase
LTIIGSTMGPSADFRTVMNLIFEGKLRPVIDSVFPLSEAQETMKRMESGDFYGKIVLHISDD